MSGKTVQISVDDVTYYTLPGSQGELSREAATPDDTIFGQSFKSTFAAILGWSLTANAIYKGFAGYMATLKRVGTPTSFTAAACTLVSVKTYQINDTTKRIWDRTAAFIVYDNAVDQTDEVESIDYLFGKVTFKSTYTVNGPVTVTGKSFPVSALGSYRGFTLTQQTDAVDTTDYPTAQANNGYRTSQCGLRTVSLEVPGVYKAVNALKDILEGREEVIIEINPDGQSKSVARGFFIATRTNQSGNVGALEEENITFNLAVPIESTNPQVAMPFGWSHAVDSPIPAAIKTALTAWEGEDLIYVRYLDDGVNGAEGQGVLTNLTLSSTLEGVNTFQVNVAGSGSLTDYP